MPFFSATNSTVVLFSILFAVDLNTPSPCETFPRIGYSPVPTYTISGLDSLTALCTCYGISRRVGYYDRDGHELAVVHELVLPDGSVGGSGRPDPVRIEADGIVYVASGRFIARRA